MISLDRNDRKVTNLLFVLPIFLFYSNILETEEILQFSDKNEVMWNDVPRTSRIFCSKIVIFQVHSVCNILSIFK